MRTFIWLAALGAIACGGGKDRDKDGFGEDVDCDDEDASVFPGAPEACDAVDSDCDGDMSDVAAGAGTLFYLDSDGDGFGDPATGVEGCEAPASYVADGSDCDDGAASVAPGAAEVCDGADTDCDPSTEDAGVAFAAADGTWADLTAVFAAGTSDAPALVPLDEDGVLHVCEGLWYASLPVTADVSIVGEGSAELSGGLVEPVITVVGDYDLSVADLVVSLAAPSALTSEAPVYELFGAGLACAEGATVVADNVTLLGSYADAGGAAAAVNGCDLTMTNSTVSGGSAFVGGGLYVDSSTFTGVNVRFFSNTAEAGGGLFAGPYYAELLGLPSLPTVVDCTDCEFLSNAGGQASALLVYAGTDVTLRGGSVRGNQGYYGLGSVTLYESFVDPKAAGPSLRLEEVWFGLNTDDAYGGTDAIYLVSSGLGYSYDDVEVSVTCDASACVEL